MSAAQPVRLPMPVAPDATVDIATIRGLPPVLDRLADIGAEANRFLRAAWYAGCGVDATTLVARGGGGAPLLAIPTIPAGPGLLGARMVPGCYWPHRSVSIAPIATSADLVAAFDAPATRRALGPAWRLGPVAADDPALLRLAPAACAAGWTVLRRSLGHSFVVAPGAPDNDGADAWPRRSTRRRLANHERRLAAAIGPVTIRTVTGADWDAGVLATLGGIEAASWVARDTDGHGAKFLTADQRDRWTRVLADPVLADALSATILVAGDTPVAFSFDLAAGTVQHAIASGYDTRFANYRVGSLVTAHQFAHAAARGIARIDLGMGDSGYKQQMGAVRGPELIDCLFVRSRSAATLIRRRWEGDRTTQADPHALRRREPWLALALIAATTAVALAE